MTRYQKIWVTCAGIFLFIYFGLLIVAKFTTDSNENIDYAIKNADSTNVESIEIAPYNPDWNINLTDTVLLLTNKEEINNILGSLKNVTKKYFKKGTKINWYTYLSLNFSNEFYSKLRNRKKLTLCIYNSVDGLYLERLNVMGNQRYSSLDLKEKLERIARNHK